MRCINFNCYQISIIMEDFRTALNNLKHVSIGTDMNELGGGVLASLISLSEVMLKFGVPTMTDEFDDTFSVIYYEHLNGKHFGSLVCPKAISDAADIMAEKYGIWYVVFIKEHY